MIAGATRIVVGRREEVGTNDLGEPIYETVYVPYFGELVPLGSNEPLRAGTIDTPVVTRYRLILPATAVLKPADAILAYGETYEVQGDPERHVLRGRPHHLEVIVERRYG